MENAVTHVLFLAAILTLFTFARTGRIRYELAPIVFLASISRIEGIFHVGPLLVIFSIFWLFAFKTRQGLYFSGVVLALWFTFNLWRYLYFGDLSPNTAHAQGITLDDRLDVWTRAGWDYFSQVLPQSNAIFSQHGGYLPMVASLVLLFILYPTLSRNGGGGGLLFLLLGVVILTSYLTPLVFGGARLDGERTTTHLAVIRR